VRGCADEDAVNFCQNYAVGTILVIPLFSAAALKFALPQNADCNPVIMFLLAVCLHDLGAMRRCAMEGITPVSKGDFAVKLMGPVGSAGEGIFHLEDLGGSCKLTLRTGDTEFSATSSDFFDALVQLRRRLEKHQIFPVCYGASRNVYPTDLSRAAAQGLMAVRWGAGKRVPGNLVFIFHSGPDVEPVTVAEQREAHQRWVTEQAVVVPFNDHRPTPKLAA
jgi:hypothetical protein